MQSGVRKTIPVSSRSHTNIPGDSTAPVSENGAKKRQREVDPESTNLDSGVVKKMRREKVSIEGSQPCDSPLHIRSPSAELRNEGKAQVEPPPLMGPEEPEEDEAAPVIGPDDYTGALSGSGDSDQEAESQSEGREVSAPARLSHPFSPANIAEVKPSLAPRKYALLCVVHVTDSLVVKSDLQAHVLLELYMGNCPHLANSTILRLELLLLKSQSSCSNLQVHIYNPRKSQPRRTRVISTPRLVLSNAGYRLRIVLPRDLRLLHDICLPSLRKGNASRSLNASGPSYLRMKTISSALHLLK